MQNNLRIAITVLDNALREAKILLDIRYIATDRQDYKDCLNMVRVESNSFMVDWRRYVNCCKNKDIDYIAENILVRCGIFVYEPSNSWMIFSRDGFPQNPPSARGYNIFFSKEKYAESFAKAFDYELRGCDNYGIYCLIPGGVKKLKKG